MKPGSRIPILLAVFAFFSIQTALDAGGAFIYKNYVIKRDRGWDILCDPYVVKKNDYVLKLFKQRGEIAQKDFGHFLQVFRRINPHIRNVNNIRPGQHILIPLRKLKYGSLDGQATGKVTIPFVTLSQAPGPITEEASIYRVRRGDCVSILIAREFGAYGTAAYREGIRMFRLLNPEITDLDRIYAGQLLRLPGPFMRLPEAPEIAAESLQSPAIASGPSIQDMPVDEKSVLESLAETVEARLKNKGSYFFPNAGGKDFELKLSDFPVLEMGDGRRVVFTKDKSIGEADRNILKNSWKRLKLVELKAETGIEDLLGEIAGKDDNSKGNVLTILSDTVKIEIHARYILEDTSKVYPGGRKICITPIQNPGQKTTEAISRFLETRDIVIREPLADRRKMHSEKQEPVPPPMTEVIRIQTSGSITESLGSMLEAAGLRFFRNVRITFPYAGVQTEALSNLISLRDGREMLVDFNELEEDAIQVIQQTGFKIIRIDPGMMPMPAMIRVFEEIGAGFQKDPVLLAADRPDIYNTKIFFSGILFETDPDNKVLFSDAPVNEWLSAFLAEKNIRMVVLGGPSES